MTSSFQMMRQQMQEEGDSKRQRGHVLLSPYSLRRALIPAYLGAAGNTAKQMGSFLGFGAKAVVNSADVGEEGSSTSVSKDCTGSAAIPSAEVVEPTRSISASLAKAGILEFNALLKRKEEGFELNPEFRKELNNGQDEASDSCCLAHLVDFSSSQEAVDITNKECSRNTGGLIPILLTKDDLDGAAESKNGKKEDDDEAQTKVILLNTIYFKGTWAKKFKKAETIPAYSFTRLNRTTIRVPMMAQKNMKGVGYYHDADTGTQFIRLGYSGQSKSISLYIELPKAKDQMPSFQELLLKNCDEGMVGGGDEVDAAGQKKNNQREGSFFSKFKEVEIDLYFPSFKITQRSYLKSSLIQLGLTDAFNDYTADFSRMTSRKNRGGQNASAAKDEDDNSRQGLVIDDVIQEVVFQCDEEGTVGAAATAVVMRTKCAKPPRKHNPIKVVCDHAFGFALIHEPSQTALFTGVYNGGPEGASRKQGRVRRGEEEEEDELN